MKILSAAIVDGVIADVYGKRGPLSAHGMPTYSWPITIESAPGNTVCFALFMEDRDAIPVCGFSWIHWCATNIPKTGEQTSIAENASLDKLFIQGQNSWSGKIAQRGRDEAIGYGGMAPPDCPHEYRLTVYALSQALDLGEGFYANQLLRALAPHCLSSATLTGIYSN